MFDQESYNNATQVESQKGDLFHNYEIRTWNYSATLYKILAISAVLNIAVLAFIGQTNLLTLRGCDSPFVGRVCQVLDMAYVGTVLFGTEREYVDMEYEKTDLGDAEITYIIETPDNQPLYYPADYFRMANPEQYAMLNETKQTTGITDLNGFSQFQTQTITPSTSEESELLKLRPQPPTPKPNAFQDDGSFTRNGANAVSRKRSRGGRVSIPEDKTETAVKPETTETPTVTSTDPITEKVINKRAFKDLANRVNERVTNEKLNLDTPFLIKATGKLNKEGKLEKATFKYLKAESADPQVIKTVQDSIETFNDSGFLQYLSDLTGKTLDLSVQQDDTNISAVVQAELERDTRARSIATALKIGVDWAIGKKEGAIAQMEKENDPAKAVELRNDKDDLELLKNTKVEAVGNKIVINFNVAKGIVQAMIQRKLQEQAAELKKENGTAQSKPDGNTAK